MKYIIPAFIFIIVSTSLVRRINVYDEFLSGAENGMHIVASIFPTLLGILTAVAMLRASGAMDFLQGLLLPITSMLNAPAEVMPLALIRPVSGSGALGILTDILSACGADSRAGRIASVIMGSTETTFYTLCVYFRNTHVKRTGTLSLCALFGDIVGFLVSIVCINIFFS